MREAALTDRPTEIRLVPTLSALAGMTKEERRGCAAFVLLDGQQTMKIACPGCGELAHTSLHTLDVKGDVVTLSPSLLCPANCGAHYYVRENRIEWC